MSKDQTQTRKWTRKDKMQAVAMGLIFVVATAGILLQSYQINQLNERNFEIQETINDLIQINDANSNNSDIFATVYYTVKTDGDIVFKTSDHNLITDAGRTALRGHIGNTAIAVWDYIGLGTGIGGTTASTDVVTPFSTRGAGTYAAVSTFNFSITYEFAAGFFSGQTITETGCFNALTGVTMLSYDDSFTRTLYASDSLEIVFMFQVGS